MSTDEDKLRLYIAQGETCYRKGDYKRAVNAYTEALGIKVDDRNLLLARSQCYVALGQAKEAIEDANECIKSDETFYKGLYQKAEALYAAGEFEFALVYYYRAHRLRTDILEYRLGIQKAEQAILRAISQDSGPNVYSGKQESITGQGNNTNKKGLKGTSNNTNGLGNSKSLSNRGISGHSSRDGNTKESKSRNMKNEEPLDIPDIAAPQTVYGHVFNQKPPIGINSTGGMKNTSTINNIGYGSSQKDGMDGTSSKVLLTTNSGINGSGNKNKKGPELAGKAHPSQRLLGELYEDRKFLEDLKRDEAIGKNKDSGISKIVDSGIEYIDARTEFWRQQKPPTVDGDASSGNNNNAGSYSMDNYPKNDNNYTGNPGNGLNNGNGTIYSGNANAQGGDSIAGGYSSQGKQTGSGYTNKMGYGSTTGSKGESSLSRQVSRSLNYIQQSLSNILSALSKNTPALALQIAQALIRRVEEATNTQNGALKDHPDKDKIRCDCFTALGWSYFESNDYGKAFMAYDRALEEISGKKSLEEENYNDEGRDGDNYCTNPDIDYNRVLRSIRNLARSSQRTPDMERTKRYYLKVLEMNEAGTKNRRKGNGNKDNIDSNNENGGNSKDNNDQSGSNSSIPRVYIMDSYIQLGRLLFDSKDYDNALMYTTDVLRIAYPDIMVYLDIGYDPKSYEEKEMDIEENYEKAIDLLDQDLLADISNEQSLFEQSVPIYPLDPTPQELLLDTLCLIGRIWYMQKNYSIAYRALRICQVLARVFCDDAAEGASMTNLCFVCSKMGNEEEAKVWEERARTVIGEVE